MSQPVFLESAPWPRMPQGRQGELSTYYQSGGCSLEANGSIPLLWLAMYAPADLQWAWMIDDFDPDTEQIELEEYLHGGGTADAQYPYLVTEKKRALHRLMARREPLIAMIGDTYRPIYDAFIALVDKAYGPFLLVRTSGLADVTDAGPWMMGLVEDVARLDTNNRIRPKGPLSETVADFQQYKKTRHPIELLSGYESSGNKEMWPPHALAALYPDPAPKAVRQGKAQPRAPSTRFDTALEWLASIFIAVPTLTVFLWTKSAWLGLASFVATGAIATGIFILIERRR